MKVLEDDNDLPLEVGAEQPPGGELVEWSLTRMEAQLKLWSRSIDKLVASMQLDGKRPGTPVLLHVDELKVLHATALARMNEYRDGGGEGAEEEARREGELEKAWKELEAAFRKVKS